MATSDDGLVKSGTEPETTGTQPDRAQSDNAAWNAVDGVDLNQVFICSAPTEERLSEIFRCFIWGNVRGHEQSTEDMRGYFTIYGRGRRIEDGPVRPRFQWTMLDPDLDDAVASSPSLVADRIRHRWPVAFGHLETDSHGRPASFHWANTAPELLWGAFYRLTSEGQPMRTAVWGMLRRGPTRWLEKGLVSAAPHGIPSHTELSGSHGRIWILAIPLRSSPFVRSAGVMPLEVLAFLGNYCQSVGLFDPYVEQLRPEHPYHHGFSFGHDFVGGPFARPWRLNLRRTWSQHPKLGKPTPGELVMQYHVRHLAVNETLFQESLRWNDPEDSGPMLPGLAVRRDRGAIEGNRRRKSPIWTHGYIALKMRMRLIERVSSASLSIVNTNDAPYTIIVLADKGQNPIWRDPDLVGANVSPASDKVFPDTLTAQENGLSPSGRCTGLTQFFSMILTLFRHWEEQWTKTLGELDRLTRFSLSDTLDNSSLDSLMFDESFSLSRTYFATLQTLRVASNMVEDTLKQWAELRQQWDLAVCPSGMFNPQDLAASSNNWEVVTRVLETRAQRVQACITRKSEDVKSLRDGLFNATSLRESTKGIALNRAVYVFTVVTVLYTPLGFLATFWAMPIFNKSGSSSNETSATADSDLPPGFKTTFIAVPLATYLLCIAVIWTMGFNARERLVVRRAVGFVPEVVRLQWNKWRWQRRQKREERAQGRDGTHEAAELAP